MTPHVLAIFPHSRIGENTSALPSSSDVDEPGSRESIQPFAIGLEISGFVGIPDAAKSLSGRRKVARDICNPSNGTAIWDKAVPPTGIAHRIPFGRSRKATASVQLLACKGYETQLSGPMSRIPRRESAWPIGSRSYANACAAPTPLRSRGRKRLARRPGIGGSRRELGKEITPAGAGVRSATVAWLSCRS
jgi:hypothetical protein